MARIWGERMKPCSNDLPTPHERQNSTPRPLLHASRASAYAFTHKLDIPYRLPFKPHVILLPSRQHRKALDSCGVKRVDGRKYRASLPGFLLPIPRGQTFARFDSLYGLPALPRITATLRGQVGTKIDCLTLPHATLRGIDFPALSIAFP